MRAIHTLVIHHSAGAYGNVELFRKLHKEKKWIDVGYHEVICNGAGGPDGHIQQGRTHTRIGAGVSQKNHGMLQVCLVGNFDEHFPTVKQMNSLGHWLLTNAKRYGTRKVAGHREVARKQAPTACPGRNLPLAEIREWFSRYVEADSVISLGAHLLSKGIKLRTGG